ncbi:GntR family transcriptional regulator [Arcobacter sp.]|uniref:GntR family transcriptional regulator n=1 Tax=Arcobacter sp. TaxID=1872629 RepID=UPI003C775BEC
MIIKTHNTTDQVYNEILQKIISLELPPGTSLSRQELVQEFGVSKTPIREALLRLELDGLVTIYPQAKTVVTKINIDEIKDANFLRTALEVEIVRKLVKKSNPEIIKKLRQNLEGQKALMNVPSQMQTFFQLDRQFHEILFESVNQKKLHKYVSADIEHRIRAVILEFPKKGKLDYIYNEHKNITDAIESKNEATAENTMREHLNSIENRIEEIKKDKPEYFI